MGLRRFFKNRIRDFRLSRATLEYEGLVISTRRSGMIEPILRQLYYNEYERPEIEGLLSVINVGDRVLEMGAGLGIITALAAQAAGPSGRIRSYEANPGLISDTRDFLQSNGISNVELIHSVLVCELDAAPRTFHLAESFAVGSLLGTDGRAPRGSIQVPSVSLSKVLSEFQPDVLICDIEGAEVELFPSLPPSTLRAAVVELHPDRLTQGQIQSIHDGFAAQGMVRKQPEPGGTVELYVRHAPS